MNRREILQITGVGAMATAAQAIPAPATARHASTVTGLPTEVADPGELERINTLWPSHKRKDFRVITWSNAQDSPSIDEIFNSMSIAGYSYVECLDRDWGLKRFLFARTVEREPVA